MMFNAEALARRTTETIKVAFVWARGHALLIALVLLGVSVPLWLLEHDAQLRREVEWRQVRQQTGKEVGELRARAEAAMAEFRSNALLIDRLEARRQGLEREAATLRQRLSSLRKEESRVQQAATPGSIGMPPGSAPLPEQVSGAGFQSPPGTRNLTPDTLPAPCREQSALQDRLISNCEQRVEVSRAALEAAKKSALDLQDALRVKDDIAARQEAAHRAELKAARGSRLRRFGRVLQYVGVGVVIGVVVAR